MAVTGLESYKLFGRFVFLAAVFLQQCATRFFNTKIRSIEMPRRELGLEKPMVFDFGRSNTHGFLRLRSALERDPDAKMWMK